MTQVSEITERGSQESPKQDYLTDLIAKTF